MAIDQKMRPAIRALLKGPRQGDWVPLRRAKARVQSDALAVALHPLGARLQIFPMPRLGRHAREANVLAYAIDEALLVVPEVLQHAVHAPLLAAIRPRSKEHLSEVVDRPGWIQPN